MTKDEALRLALEWLETHKPKISEGSLFVLTHAQVYIAVKTALANEALERKAENARELGLNYYVPCCTDKTCPKCKAALEAKDEPVAWGVFEGNLHDMFFSQEEAQEMADLKGTHAEVRPLYATPQRTWVGLTDGDIAEIYNQKDWDIHTNWDYERAIEAKLKEKNNG